MAYLRRIYVRTTGARFQLAAEGQSGRWAQNPGRVAHPHRAQRRVQGPHRQSLSMAVQGSRPTCTQDWETPALQAFGSREMAGRAVAGRGEGRMTPERESGLAFARTALKLSTSCRHHNAAARADALALATAAVAEGIWPVTPEMLDELSHLAQAIVWDLAVAL